MGVSSFPVSTVAVIGAGAWGTAIAAHAARRGHEVRLWSYETDVASDINTHHENRIFLAGIGLPEAIRASSSLSAVVPGADLVVLVPPSGHLRRVSLELRPLLGANVPVVVATKGIEERSLKLMSEVLAETVPELGWDRLSFLSGPNFAKEVAKGLPTDSVVASKDERAARAVQDMLHATYLRVYTSNDPIGVQVGGSVKNVLAIATGTCDGLHMGLNARAALMTRGLSEMARLGAALGADPLTFMGMAGVGDLILTCTGDLSRNRQLGMKLAEGVDPKAYLATQRSVAEGYSTAQAANALAKLKGVDMPITEQVHSVLHEGKPLLDALKSLLTREQKHELYGLR